MTFDHYLAFGDSISIDEYAGPLLGAASLLHRNRDDLWPEFAGKDLVSLNPHCGYTRLAFDGSTLVGAWMQLEKAPRVSGRVLVTLTIGGNDILAGLGWSGRGFRERYFSDVQEYLGAEGEVTFPLWFASLRRWLDEVRRLYPDSLLILGNVYDPSDGSGRLASGDASLAPLLPLLHQMNQSLRELAAEQDLRFADIYRHFLGHALGDPPWVHCEIEPTQRGSSEVRRLFWEASIFRGPGRC